MSKKKIILYSFSFLLLLTTTGCSASNKQTSGIRGKFIFDSNRVELPDVFVTENGKTKLLLKKAMYPAWSTNGKMIACAGSVDSSKKYGLWLIDSKGNKKEFIESPVGLPFPSNLNWSPDDTKIYYAPSAILVGPGYKNKVYYYDLLSKTHTKIIELDENFKISNMKLSPEGDKLIIEGSNKRELALYLSNNDGTNLRMIRRYGGVDAAWYPDNKHIIYLTNVSEDGQIYIKEGWGKIGWGYFFKMNVNTGEVEKLWLCKTPFLLNLKISRDGKYFYYIASAPRGGRAVFVSPIDNPDKKIQITQPIFLTPASYGRSQDDNPDWYQD